MDTELLNRLLAVHHHQIDQDVDGSVDGTGETQALAAVLKFLREHVHVEESTLFPALAESGLAIPVFKRCRQRAARECLPASAAAQDPQHQGRADRLRSSRSLRSRSPGCVAGPHHGNRTNAGSLDLRVGTARAMRWVEGVQDSAIHHMQIVHDTNGTDR